MDYESIKKLIDDMGNSKLSSLEIDFPDGTKINMKKGNGQNCLGNKDLNEINENIDFGRKDNTESVHQNSAYKNISINTEENNNNQSNVNAEDDKIYKYVKSPMVGTFYSKPSPDEKSYIEVGEKIKKGATTCIIEAMKLMNEIETEFEGEVVEILKKDGDPVEYGENLIKLK